jgi:hypothetical protein
MVRWSGIDGHYLRRMGNFAVSLQIAKLILYSRTGEARELSFRTGAMNILTGASKTGKSAIIDIVDYVTGRSECNVADGVIRKYVGWYALIFQLNEGQIFVARRNPEVGERTSGDVYLARASHIEIPPASELIKNITVNALESFLGAAIGISENEHRPPVPTRDSLEANFRHAILFSFQDQNDIDSKQRLFHRQGEDYVDAINEVYILSRSQDLNALHTAVRRLAALERYSQRSDSKLRKNIVEKEVRPR